MQTGALRLRPKSGSTRHEGHDPDGQHDPSTARLYAADFTGNADLPYDFFMSRYKEAYHHGHHGGKSAAEQRWVRCSEVAASVQCDENGCMIVDLDDMAIAAAEKDSLNWIGKNVNRVLGKKGGLKPTCPRANPRLRNRRPPNPRLY